MHFDRKTFFDSYRESRALYVFPISAFADAVDRLLAHAVLSPKLSKPCPVFKREQDLSNLNLSQLRGVDAFAPHAGFGVRMAPVPFSDRRSPFNDRILSVVPTAAKKEMRGVYARRVVAFMADLKLIGVNAVVNEVSNAVGLQRLLHNFNVPVSVTVAASLPLPTKIIGQLRKLFSETANRYLRKYRYGRFTNNQDRNLLRLGFVLARLVRVR